MENVRFWFDCNSGWGLIETEEQLRSLLDSILEGRTRSGRGSRAAVGQHLLTGRRTHSPRFEDEQGKCWSYGWRMEHCDSDHELGGDFPELADVVARWVSAEAE